MFSFSLIILFPVVTHFPCLFLSEQKKKRKHFFYLHQTLDFPLSWLTFFPDYVSSFIFFFRLLWNKKNNNFLQPPLFISFTIYLQTQGFVVLGAFFKISFVFTSSVSFMGEVCLLSYLLFSFFISIFLWYRFRLFLILRYHYSLICICSLICKSLLIF